LLENKKQQILNKYRLQKDNYILLTTHRPVNVDNKENLKNLLE
jgi:UDP-N-acetylglucosamine 2-epimerase